MKEKQVKKNNYTKSLRKKYYLFSTLSWILCYGIAAAFIIVGLSRGWGSGDHELEKKVGTILYSLGITLIITMILAIIVKDKIKPTVWMANIVLATYLFSTTITLLVFVVWLIDNYVISYLAKRNREKYIINKEIDKR